MRNESKQKALRETLEMKQSLLERNFILFCNKDGSFKINVKRKGDKASELTGGRIIVQRIRVKQNEWKTNKSNSYQNISGEVGHLTQKGRLIWVCFLLSKSNQFITCQ